MSSRSFALIHRPQAWMYDADSMTQLPQRVGFGDVVRCSYRQGECPDVERLDTCSEKFLLEANAQQVGYLPMATFPGIEALRARHREVLQAGHQS